MISYAPLWETMRRKGVTTYALRKKYQIGGGTLQRLKENDTVSTHTLDLLCEILDCPLWEIAEYRPNKQ